MLVVLSNPRCSLSDESTFMLFVKAKVIKGYAYIIGAKIEVQAGSMPWKHMKDDGIGRFNFIRFLAIRGRTYGLRITI